MLKISQIQTFIQKSDFIQTIFDLKVWIQTFAENSDLSGRHALIRRQTRGAIIPKTDPGAIILTDLYSIHRHQERTETVKKYQPLYDDKHLSDKNQILNTTNFHGGKGRDNLIGSIVYYTF